MKRNLPLVAALAALALHLAGNAHYGFFRDELYFIACGRHPALGYVDQPPLVPWLAAATQTFGHSLFLLRAIPAFASAGTCGLAVLFARRLGGDAFAQLLTALCTALAPALLVQGLLLITDVFSALVWTLAIFCLHRLATRGDDLRTGAALGFALGIAAMSKYAIAFFAFSAVVGLLLAPQRRVLATRAVALAAAISVALAAPSVLWQFAHGWPFLELLKNGAHGKNVVLGPAAFALAQIVMLDPLYAPVWVAGLWLLLRRSDLRWIGSTYFVLYVVLFALHAKDYYLLPIYPVLFAAGAVQIEAWTRAARLRPARFAVVAATALAGLALLPLGIPVLPVDAFIAYERALHITPASAERKTLGALPQYYADMFGWPELATSVARAYQTLTPRERTHAYVLAGNYGEASAIAFFGQRLGLPPPISGHNAYSTWGYGAAPDADIMIDVGATVADDRRFCADARQLVTAHDAYAMPYEADLGVVVCRGMHLPLRALFPKQRHVD